MEDVCGLAGSELGFDSGRVGKGGAELGLVAGEKSGVEDERY